MNGLLLLVFLVFLLACIGTGKFSLFTVWELPVLGEDGEMVWEISAAELGGYSDISFGSSMLSISGSCEEELYVWSRAIT